MRLEQAVDVRGLFLCTFGYVGSCWFVVGG